ncbi:ABC transporter substrate-binding protein, partial [Morganella morganii]
AHSNASAFAFNDGKSSTVAWLNGWDIPQLSQTTLKAVAEPDKAKRAQMYTAMQEELQRSSPYVFMAQGQNQVVLRDNVKGYQQGLNADMVYYDRVTK